MPRAELLIIGLAGNAGTGKDTAAEYLQDWHGFHRFAFADPMRAMLDGLLDCCGIDHAWLYERSLKEEVIPELGCSYRHLAQTLGTEWARELIHPEFWVRTAAVALGLHDLPCSSPVHDRIVISDVRFPNEAEWITRMGGVVIRLHRPTPGVRPHISEALLSDIEPWACIDNSGTLEQLEQQLAGHVHALTSPEQSQ